jgi:glycosyltransferase involved in cell wall biosynthesis
VFVGSFLHPPNVDGVKWLVGEVMPVVFDKIPSMRVYIAGSDPTDEVLSLAGPGIEVLGWLPSLGFLYDKARVFVAPLRFGAGMKGKVGESLAHGLPVVTTEIGGEGMGLRHGYDVLVADDGREFAEHVIQLHEDEQLWARLARNGRTTVAERYSPQAVHGQLVDVLDELGLIGDLKPPAVVPTSDLWG